MGTAKERAAARYGRVERNRFTPYGALATASQELKSAYYYYGWPRDEDMPELPQPKWDAESQATPEELVNEKQTAELIVAMLAALRPQQAKVLQLRFGFDCVELTLREVGYVSDLSTERIRQIEQAGLRTLRTFCGIHGLTGIWTDK